MLAAVLIYREDEHRRTAELTAHYATVIAVMWNGGEFLAPGGDRLVSCKAKKIEY